MPWFIRFSFLTAPPLVGVAFTLSWPASGRPHDLATVAVVGLAWLGAAYLVQRKLREHELPRWPLWWLLACVVLPLAGLFTYSLCFDPAVAAFFDRHNAASARRGPGDLAPSAPSRYALSWDELRELVACVRPCGVRFTLQLLTSLPPAWWLAAFGISLWKRK